MNITGYSLKGFITFWIVVILLLTAFFSGNFSGAGQIFLVLIGGIILYQIMRFVMRAITGWDPHEGTTRSGRTVQKELERSLNTTKENSKFKKWKCDSCRKVFKSELALDSHKKTKHNIEK